MKEMKKQHMKKKMHKGAGNGTPKRDGSGMGSGSGGMAGKRRGSGKTKGGW